MFTFGDIEIEKRNFTAIKVIFLKDIDIGKVLESHKISCGEENYECFIGYLYNVYNDHKFKPLRIMFPKKVLM